MSLPARQQRVLDRIEHSLHVREPHLKSMFAVFTKLTEDEEMPRLEELRPRPLLFPGCRKRLARPGRKGQAATGAGATGAAGARLRALLLIPVMLLVLAPGIVFGLAIRSQSPCGSAIRPPHTAAALSPPKTCRPKFQILVHQRLPNG
jgi:hypothetical protein